MARAKRPVTGDEVDGQPSERRRSGRQSAQNSSKIMPIYRDASTEPEVRTAKKRRVSASARTAQNDASQPLAKKAAKASSSSTSGTRPGTAVAAAETQAKSSAAGVSAKKSNAKAKGSTVVDSHKSANGGDSSRAISEDPDVDSIPAQNQEVTRHDGEWYWLMKAEPETRLENGIDVRFSIDDLKAKAKPEPWDGIRAYPARNNMRNMNLGDKAFFYHSNCKEPGIFGIMEVVKEYSEDRGARRPGTPYYDPKATKDNNRWSLVHVKFVQKFAVPIFLKELREMGQQGRELQDMQMLKQSRLSVSKVSQAEWEFLCEVADLKAKEAGLEHDGAT